jgi:hypothetical protein
MSYKTLIKKKRQRLKDLIKYAEDNGWKSGLHIGKILTDRELWEYIRLRGEIEGMQVARRLTMKEHSTMLRSVKK